MNEVTKRMNFSLVVTCFNEMKSLPRWYEDVMAQTRPPDEILVVDSESTDGTTDFLMRWGQRDQRVKVIVTKCKPARGHNIGNELARNEYIVSTDMGVRLDKRWFEEIVKPVEEDPTVDVVAGSVLFDPDTIKNAAARAEYYIDSDAHRRLEPRCIVGNSSVVYSKKIWRELGGLPEDLTFYADDSVFGRQIVASGCKIAVAPKAIVLWARHQRLSAFWKETFGYGRGDGEAAIKTPIAFRLYKRGFLPRFLVPALTGLRVLSKQLTLRNVWKGLCKGDVVACLYMPLLLFGKGYYFGKSYLVGDAYGEKHCQACRARLHEYNRQNR